jgi:hypothetical protein
MPGLPSNKPMMPPGANVGPDRDAQQMELIKGEGFKGGTNNDRIAVAEPAGAQDAQSRAATLEGASNLLQMQEDAKLDNVSTGGGKRKVSRRRRRKTVRRRRKKSRKTVRRRKTTGRSRKKSRKARHSRKKSRKARHSRKKSRKARRSRKKSRKARHSKHRGGKHWGCLS